MRANIVLDDELVAEAMKASGAQKPSARSWTRRCTDSSTGIERITG